MTAREDTIERIERVLNLTHKNSITVTIPKLTAERAVYMLKEQEAVEPTLKREGWNKYYNYYVCPRCGNDVDYDQNYCSECGIPFLWERR